MHILLVNDDGIGSVGIMALFHEALKRGHRVTMCAPAAQQSAASHRITLTEPIMAKTYPVDSPMAEAYAIHGSPVDCVRLGLLGGLAKKPDLVLSGINNGYNAGMAVQYSGTVGAAMEGALYRLPSIAASIDYGAEPQAVRELAEYVIQVAERYATRPAAPGQMLNLNAPALPRAQWEKAVYAPIATGFFCDGYDRLEGGRVGSFFCLQSGSDCGPATEGTDLWYLERKHVVFTLLGNPVCAPEADFAALGLTD